MRNRRSMVIVGLCVFFLSAGIFPRAALARSWARAREPQRHHPAARAMRYAGRDYRYHQGRFLPPRPPGEGVCGREGADRGVGPGPAHWVYGYDWQRHDVFLLS